MQQVLQKDNLNNLNVNHLYVKIVDSMILALEFFFEYLRLNESI